MENKIYTAQRAPTLRINCVAESEIDSAIAELLTTEQFENITESPSLYDLVIHRPSQITGVGKSAKEALEKAVIEEDISLWRIEKVPCSLPLQPVTLRFTETAIRPRCKRLVATNFSNGNQSKRVCQKPAPEDTSQSGSEPARNECTLPGIPQVTVTSVPIMADEPAELPAQNPSQAAEAAKQPNAIEMKTVDAAAPATGPVRSLSSSLQTKKLSFPHGVKKITRPISGLRDNWRDNFTDDKRRRIVDKISAKLMSVVKHNTVDDVLQDNYLCQIRDTVQKAEDAAFRECSKGSQYNSKLNEIFESLASKLLDSSAGATGAQPVVSATSEPSPVKTTPVSKQSPAAAQEKAVSQVVDTSDTSKFPHLVREDRKAAELLVPILGRKTPWSAEDVAIETEFGQHVIAHYVNPCNQLSSNAARILWLDIIRESVDIGERLARTSATTALACWACGSGVTSQRPLSFKLELSNQTVQMDRFCAKRFEALQKACNVLGKVGQVPPPSNLDKEVADMLRQLRACVEEATKASKEAASS